MTRMRFGLAVENFTPAPRVPDLDAIVAYGRRAEELGYDSLWPSRRGRLMTTAAVPGAGTKSA
jgi:hypothetical protein